MVKRLRHVDTGAVYGWNRDMAVLPYLEEFDDEEPSTEPSSKSTKAKAATVPPVQTIDGFTVDELKNYQAPTDEELDKMEPEQIKREMAIAEAHEKYLSGITVEGKKKK